MGTCNRRGLCEAAAEKETFRVCLSEQNACLETISNKKRFVKNVFNDVTDFGFEFLS